MKYSFPISIENGQIYYGTLFKIIDKVDNGTKVSNSKKTKLSFTDSSIILTMQESNINDLVSFDQQFKNFDEINVIGLDYL